MMHRSFKPLLESLVVVAILLVIVQTFLEDYAVVAAWSWDARRALVVAGFFFDLFFTLEFLTRFYSAVFRGEGCEYFFRRRGWIDFLASIPLILFSSGPAVLSIYLGGNVAYALGSFFNVLKVIKAIRIARFLRLLRVLKVFKQIRYTNSVMAQRHVARLTTMTVSVIVLMVFAATIGVGLTNIPSVEEIVRAQNVRVSEELATELATGEAIQEEELNEYPRRSPDLLIVKVAGETIHTRFDNLYYRSNFGPSDYQYIERGRFGFFFDLRDMLRIQSADALVYLVMIVFLVLFLLVSYRPHLYLPLKDRNRNADEEGASVLNFDEVKDILSEE